MIPLPPLAEFTTLRLGGPPGRYVDADSEIGFVGAVCEADETDETLLVLGGGSNVVVADEGFAGVVVRDLRREIVVEAGDPSSDGVRIRVAAGTPWEDVAERAVGEGWVGVEALSGIPGSTGATPVQNVGAYGQEAAGVISDVRVWDRDERRTRTLVPVELEFGYRTSILKRSLRTRTGEPSSFAPTPRYVVLSVGMQMRTGALSAPIEYPELAALLGVRVGGCAPLADVRAAVLQMRGRKGMLVDEWDADTWSAGSFFTNPVIPVALAHRLPEGAPRYAVRAGRPRWNAAQSVVEVDESLVKTSAAWLIEHSGFGRGYGLPGSVSLSTKHALALTNRGGGTTAELLDLARKVRDGVYDRFGVMLEPEPVLVGVSL
jgi:UDP-N-acetylmuramate dehydrogenase